MHGRRRVCIGERNNYSHMWKEPTRVNSNSNSLVVDVSSSSSSTVLSSPNSFLKDGRRVSVGDCALFKPPQDSPPFIGIIRWLTPGKENVLKLGVNWLYRPAEVKVGKGILLEAAPNELFYSFHKDEIPAASLLHPCKVAFLPKSVELPSGFCSFVCRRVYDITNKCLWWLTEQDYINERQEEVDQLLYKTRTEMHATASQGGRSPKPMNGPTSTSQLKPDSDSIQNNASSFASQLKGKKRERGDQGTEPLKRERSSKFDDSDSGHHRPESFWKSEIAKFTEKGGLVDSEGVEKLVQLMLPERNEKKIDLVGRSLLANVIAATDKFDCLNQFVQLRGLPVFDEWLQEVHKGKIGDGNNHRDNDKSTEEFLLVLLRALDKLPVNLHALQMCNIGKSVNHLRTHKNSEIQRKARSLVDTWKKRVEAEMDARSGSNQAVSWAARPRLSDVSHGMNRHSGASSEIAMKSSGAHLSASKSMPAKAVQMEIATKSMAVSPGSLKPLPLSASVGNNLKDGQARTGVGGASEIPLTSPRDEKSSSSSQSHNNSQSCSSEHAKTGGVSAKEDARSSTAVSMAANKTVSGSSRHRKSVNGYQGATVTGVQRDSGSSRNTSLHRSQGAEKLSLSSQAVDVPVADGNNHKLIVKISNRGRSPAQSASGGSLDDPSMMNSRASSPVLSEKHEQLDRNGKEKGDTGRTNVISDVNNESWQSNDFKEVLNGSDEGDGSPANVPNEENCRAGGEGRKLADAPRAASSSCGNGHKSGKLHEGSFSSMNALIESCVKYSEANAFMAIGDDVGMNLLASVAAGEMSKSDIASPKPSPQRDTAVAEQSCTSNDSRLKSSPGARDRRQVNDELEKRNSPTESLPESIVKSEETLPATTIAVPFLKPPDKTSNGADKATWEDRADIKPNADGKCDVKEKLQSCNKSEDKPDVAGIEGGSNLVERSLGWSSPEIGGDGMKNMKEESKTNVQAEKKPSVMMHSDFGKGSIGDALLPSSGNDKVYGNVDSEMKSEKTDETDGESQPAEEGSSVVENNVGSAVTDRKAETLEASMEGDQSREQHTAGAAVSEVATIVQEPDQGTGCRGSNLTRNDAEVSTSGAAGADSLSAAAGIDVEAKMEFDLNEGFNADDGRYGEPSSSGAPECSTAVRLASPMPLPLSFASSGLPASITVASAAKRPFVPPEDLLKNKGELGWKGSAATSAFRPAEPRKVLETIIGTGNVYLSDAASAKPSRPPLDFDLNVADERILDDLASRGSAQGTVSLADLSNNINLQHAEKLVSAPGRSSGGLDLDLNRVEEPSDMGNHLTSISRRTDARLPGIKASSAVLNGESTVRRDFDLNDGPLVDEVNAELSSFGQQNRYVASSQPSVSGLRLNNTDVGNFSWFSQVNSYPGVAIQSIIPERGDQSFAMVTPGGPQRILTSPTVSAPFSTDVYRGPVLSSAPAVPFPASPFQYPVFPFGTNFPLPSASFSGSSQTYVDSSSGGRLCFPAVPSQVLTPAGAVPSHYPRPFVVSLPDNSNNVGLDSSRKWPRQGLDLNAGPLGAEMEVRDEVSSFAARQLSVANPHSFAEEQSRMFQLAEGGILKRKEPEGGWEGYKHPSWHRDV